MSPDAAPPQPGEYQLLTSPGPAAIAVVRLRGPAAEAFLQKHVRTRPRAARERWASGQVLRGIPGEGTMGGLSTSSLEMSNVDLATEFVRLITTQRAFQANSRVITTSDEILNELINIKR